MEFIQTFGLNPILLLAQIVNFLILIFLLNRFLYKPVLKVLEERESRIQKTLSDSKEAEELLEKANQQREQILKDVSAEAQQVLQNARQEIAFLRQEFEQNSKQEYDRMLTQTRQEITNEKAIMEGQLIQKVSGIAVAIVEKVLAQTMTAQDKRKIVDRAGKELAKHLPS